MRRDADAFARGTASRRRASLFRSRGTEERRWLIHRRHPANTPTCTHNRTYIRRVDGVAQALHPRRVRSLVPGGGGVATRRAVARRRDRKKSRVLAPRALSMEWLETTRSRWQAAMIYRRAAVFLPQEKRSRGRTRSGTHDLWNQRAAEFLCHAGIGEPLCFVLRKRVGLTRVIGAAREKERERERGGGKVREPLASDFKGELDPGLILANSRFSVIRVMQIYFTVE